MAAIFITVLCMVGSLFSQHGNVNFVLQFERNLYQLGKMTIQGQIRELVNIKGAKAIPLKGTDWIAIGLTEDQIKMLQKSQEELIPWEQSFAKWKLHISADPVNAAYIMAAIKNVLWELTPCCKVLKNEEVLQEFNDFINKELLYLGQYKTGRLVTIYAENNNRIVEIAQALDKALTDAIREGKIPEPQKGTENHTDRPIGKTGHLWARHVQAGALMSWEAYYAEDTATASEGNYHITYTNDSGIIGDDEDFQTLTAHPDIFKWNWGEVSWDQSRKQFVNN